MSCAELGGCPHMSWATVSPPVKGFTSCLTWRVSEAVEPMDGNETQNAIMQYTQVKVSCSIQKPAASPIKRNLQKGRER